MLPPSRDNVSRMEMIKAGTWSSFVELVPQGNLRATLGILLGQRELSSLALRPHAPITAARMPTIAGYAGRLSASSMVKAEEVWISHAEWITRMSFIDHDVCLLLCALVSL